VFGLLGAAAELTKTPRERLTVRREGAVLVGVALKDQPIGDYPEPLAELRGLASTAGARIVDRLLQKRDKPDQSTYVGLGKVNEICESVRTHEADVVIFDNELAPAQVRNLEKRVETKVVDRTELILDIFATRAQTLQARLQVELAQLEYARPRLRRLWTHLERHGGGIGTRGPGEQQLETDRRLIDRRIRDLKARLAVIHARKKREIQARADELRVSLVGYTNAGKSTLMRRLTDADVVVADKLFATLDTRTRQWNIPGWGKVLLSDTVGFIRNLPHDLIESFKATLEEAINAHLLLHVVDASHPNARQQIEAVNQVLDEIGARNTTTLLVLNQIDRLKDPVILNGIERLYPRSVAISASRGDGISELTRAVTEILSENFVSAEICTHAGNGKLLALLSANGMVVERTYTNDKVVLRLRLPRSLLDRIKPSEASVRIVSEPTLDIT
jgi:GTP-binding protein HflX